MTKARIFALFAAVLSALAPAIATPQGETSFGPPRGLTAALADARALASRHPDAAVCVVKGQSMLPYFGDGAVLVMKPIAASNLRPGMIVVYGNRFGETVSHRVVAAVEGGWQVRGYNNDRADSTLVNDNNLRGVVYAIFHPFGARGTLAEVEQSESSHAASVVLAAPAR